MEEYRKVDVVPYVKEGIEKGIFTPRVAVKFARIIARRGIIGEDVISWSVDGTGREIQEKVAKVGIDEVGQVDWIVTKVDENGEAIVDNNGHKNEWIIKDSTFQKKYEIDPDNAGLFKPKGGPQKFVQVQENIILFQWGQDIQIAEGGFINVTDENDMYGISQRDFIDTYRFIDDLDIESPSL